MEDSEDGIYVSGLRVSELCRGTMSFVRCKHNDAVVGSAQVGTMRVRVAAGPREELKWDF